jgi:manganese transport protein
MMRSAGDLPPDIAAPPSARLGRLMMFGPAFVAAVAYVDPGNFATNFTSGANQGYELVWVVVLANLIAMLIQYLASKVGLASGRSLPELCSDRYGRRVNRMLWAQAEVVAMATDVAEFVGAAVGINLVFGLPLLPAGIVTGVAAFAILGLERQHFRAFEWAIVAMLGVVVAGLAYVMLRAGHQDYRGMAAGLLPRLDGPGTLSLAAAIVGATVMPHVTYLHSALHKTRIGLLGEDERRTLLAVNRWDCVIGLGVAGLVNLGMLCTAAATLHRPGPSAAGDLSVIHDQLQALLGGAAAVGFGVALMASGLSSASVGTYAGQVVMAGFVGWSIPLYTRRAVTMVPSLIVLGLTTDGGNALVYSQVVLSFGIPFALVPLLLLGRDRRVMGDLANSARMTAVAAAVAAVIVALNGCLLYVELRGLI